MRKKQRGKEGGKGGLKGEMKCLEERFFFFCVCRVFFMDGIRCEISIHFGGNDLGNQLR